MWSWREELNLQPAVYKTAALCLKSPVFLIYLTSNLTPTLLLRSFPRYTLFHPVSPYPAYFVA